MDNIWYMLLDAMIIIAMMMIINNRISIKEPLRVISSVALIMFCGIFESFMVTDDMVIAMINVIAVAVAAFVVCQMSIKKFVVIYVAAMLIVSVLEALVFFVMPKNSLDIVLKIVTFIVTVIGGVIVLKVSKRKMNVAVMPKRLLVGMAVMIVALLVVMAALMNYTKTSDGFLPVILSGAAIIICVAVFRIGQEGIMMEVSKANLQKEKEVLEYYNDQQKKYYELVLKSEEDTRRFRHDMLNHMLVLENYIDDGKVEECKKYISNITDSLTGSRKKIYYTGNKISDVMLTNILENKNEDVKVSVTGRLREDMPISDYDLCIVVSNIVKNAVEAVNKQQQDSDKYIKINFTVGKRYIRIEERNSIDDNQIENAKKFQTSKEDKKAHGLGVKNVKMIVEKYNGKFKSEVINNEFYVCAEMDMKSVK